MHESEPVIGPTENKIPTTIYVKHADMPGLKEAALGTRVKFMVVGKVTANRSSNEHSDGEGTIEVISIEDENTEKKKNAATMHLADLKEKIKKEPPKEEPKDEEEGE